MFSVFSLISFFALFDYMMLVFNVVAPLRNVAQRKPSCQKIGIIIKHENCLECGACKIACPKNNIKWCYPESGHGVIFKNS